jgi:hypothetical protein
MPYKTPEEKQRLEDNVIALLQGLTISEVELLFNEVAKQLRNRTIITKPRERNHN